MPRWPTEEPYKKQKGNSVDGLYNAQAQVYLDRGRKSLAGLLLDRQQLTD
jgi:hypothetical protein